MKAGVVVLVLVAACAQARPLEPNVRRQCTTWSQDVAPLVSARCDSCHSGAQPEAGYSTATYLDTIKDASAGNAASPLLHATNPATADAIHAPFAAAVFPTLSSWVVDCQLGLEPSQVHGLGILDPASPDFHGAVITQLGWNLDSCATCHGQDFGGGSSGVSCLTCHQGGPTTCTTCHAQPPSTGAHLAHVTTPTLAKKLDCVECHIKPLVYTDAGHLHPPPGHVTFGALAATTVEPAARAGPPTWDHATATCANVYCHGAAFADSAATHTAPAWVADPDEAKCGACHGLPPAGHQNTGNHCAACHGLVVGDDNHIVNAQLHVDGKVDFGGGTGCATCHGQPPATGAHLAHMNALHELASPVACAACHTVPATVDAPGHIDQVAEVFPAGTNGLGSSDGATPVFDAASATCSNVYCHGGGARLADDGAANLARTPRWTGGSDEARCGSCHGVPPVDASHAPGLQLTQCAACHPSTMDASGALRVGSGAHINGVVDVVTP